MSSIDWKGVTCTNGFITKIDLTDNGLVGSIPAELGNLLNLENLHLAVNSLTGSIPDELGNLMKLSSLTLSNNDLIGPAPSTLL